jgi:formamidopyrimidine-DNA glycosylase
MPELPEVEILARHLAPLLRDRIIRDVQVRRARTLRPTPESEFAKRLRGARFIDLSRRGKYLVFTLRADGPAFRLLGHLGMTGRMYTQSSGAALPRHAAVVFSLDESDFIFEDVRYFGRLTLDTSVLEDLGPEPLAREFTPEYLVKALKRSRRPIKATLLDQSLVAGVGNIYASEALFRAGVSPRLRSSRLSRRQVERLLRGVREVLFDAIEFGSQVRLNWAGTGKNDGLFYYGSAGAAPPARGERFEVYDREGQPCFHCRTPIQRIVQAARSTYFCPRCQRGGAPVPPSNSIDGADADL